jgi:hypothetical protein
VAVSLHVRITIKVRLGLNAILEYNLAANLPKLLPT